MDVEPNSNPPPAKRVRLDKLFGITAKQNLYLLTPQTYDSEALKKTTAVKGVNKSQEPQLETRQQRSMARQAWREVHDADNISD